MEDFATERLDIQQLERGLAGDVHLYPASVTNLGECSIGFIRLNGEHFLVACGSGPIYDEFEGTTRGPIKLCPATHANRLVLNHYLPHTAPAANTAGRPSVGFGTSGGEATGEYIEAIGEREVYPIFAQQSSGGTHPASRSLQDAIDSASWAVFAHGWTAAWGANGAHLCDETEVAEALFEGATMITIDCSGQGDNIGHDGLEKRYAALDRGERSVYEERYLDKEYQVGPYTLTLDRESVVGSILTYGSTLTLIEAIWNHQIGGCNRPIDLEVSAIGADPKEHLFIALELKRRAVAVTTLAPRFTEAEADLAIHSAIAEHFGHRLSFTLDGKTPSVCPLLAQAIDGNFHVNIEAGDALEAMGPAAEGDEGYRDLLASRIGRCLDLPAFT